MKTAGVLINKSCGGHKVKPRHNRFQQPPSFPFSSSSEVLTLFSSDWSLQRHQSPRGRMSSILKDVTYEFFICYFFFFTLSNFTFFLSKSQIKSPATHPESTKSGNISSKTIQPITASVLGFNVTCDWPTSAYVEFQTGRFTSKLNKRKISYK